MSHDKNNEHERTTKQDVKLFQQACLIDKKYGPDISAAETAAAFQKVSAAAGLVGPDHSLDSGRSHWLYAAAAMLVAGAIGLAYLLSPQTIQAPARANRSISLSDGTHIMLHSGARLSYPRWFNFWGRTVTLRGEAYFEVTHTGTPFRVKAGRGRITVMGTKFEVCARKTDGKYKTSVFLKEGKVAFSSARYKQQKVILRPGQFSWISPHQITPAAPREKKPAQARAQKHGELSFNDQPLAAIFAEIHRRFDVTIRVKPDQLREQRLTIYLSHVKNAEQVIADICRAKGLEYNKKDDIFIVTKPY